MIETKLNITTPCRNRPLGLLLTGLKTCFYIFSTGSKNLLLLFFLILFLGIIPTNLAFSKEIQARGIIHVHTKFSSGKDSIEDLVRRAKREGIKVVVLTDHDRIAMEYGIPPFRNIIRKRVEMPSVNYIGAKEYLKEIKRVDEMFQDMVIIPGVESSPYYYWTGSFFKGDLTAHSWRKHILVIGLDKPEDYDRLPVIHNGFSTKYFLSLLPPAIFFLISLVASGILVRWEGMLRAIGFLGIIFNCLMIINYHPFKSSEFSQYQEEQGIAPYQELIDYAKEKGALSFWAHPESHYSSEKVNSILMETPPHPEDLLKSKNYTGFEALYQDNFHLTEPGKEWDKVLSEYCREERPSPVWGIGGNDYHGEEKGKVTIKDVETVFLLKNLNETEVLNALKNGRMYPRINSKGAYLVLDEFYIEDSISGEGGFSGEEVKVRGPIQVSVGISLRGPKQDENLTLKIIRSGIVVKKVTGKTPLSFKFLDRNYPKREKFYYRIDAKIPGTVQLLSNPIFASF